MTAESSFDSASLTPEAARHVDEICTRFERAWKRSDRPRIEDFLDISADVERSALLAELILLDLDYRRALGEDCEAGDYSERFPGLDPAWLDRAIATPLGRGRRIPERPPMASQHVADTRPARPGGRRRGAGPSAIISFAGRSPAAGWGSSTRRGSSACIAGSPSR